VTHALSGGDELRSLLRRRDFNAASIASLRAVRLKERRNRRAAPSFLAVHGAATQR